MKLWQILSGAVVAIALVGCSSSPKEPVDANTAEVLAVTGSVTYRERMALPDNALVTIVLADASKQDVPVTILSQVTFPAAGKQVPFNFVLPYASSQLEGAQRVIVSARIDLNGQLMFANTRVAEVLTNGRNEVNLVLDRVQAAQ